MRKLIRFLACAAFVGGVACGDVDPASRLTIQATDLGPVGRGARRVRLYAENHDPQYALDAIVVKVEVACGAEMNTSQVRLKRIAPNGWSREEFTIIAPTSDGRVECIASPQSALFVVVPRSL